MSWDSSMRYRMDPEYRERQKEGVKKRHIENMSSPTYVELRKILSTLNNYRYSIEHHRKKVQSFQNKSSKLRRRKELLELAWGKERAERKRRKKNELNHTVAIREGDTQLRELREL